MEDQNTWQEKFSIEINEAISSRENGNEGRARVCARRAAGLVAAQYLLKNQVSIDGFSAYDSLRALNSQPNLPDPVKEIIDRMLMRVSPDFTLPVDADLIEDAKLFKQLLYGSS